MTLLQTFFSSAKNLPPIAAGIFGIGFVIGFHELGHFLFCKLFGIKTPSFSIGFGPKLFTKKMFDTDFSLSLIPLGGYVEIAGAAEIGQGEQKYAQCTDPDSFMYKPYWQKFLVISGGILFNLLFAYITVFALSLNGLPGNPFFTGKMPVISKVNPDGASAKKLQKNDTIIALNEIPIKNLSQLFQLVEKQSEQDISLRVKRDNTQTILSLSLGKKQQGQDMLGIYFTFVPLEPVLYTQAIKQAFRLVNQLIVQTFQLFKHIFTRGETKYLAGPLMILSISSKSASQGPKTLLLFLALISVSLAVLNILPLPIFDGGQLLCYTIEALIGHQMPVRVKEGIHYASWIMVCVLFVYLMCKDTICLLFS